MTNRPWCNKNRTLTVLLFVSFSFYPLFSQERNKGYQGNVSYSNMVLLWNGIETSHGYMFNEHHYLGVGVGILTIVPFSKPAAFLRHAFVDYHAYWYDTKSTPLAGIKIGYLCSFPIKGNMHNVEIEPYIGRSRLLKSGYGLVLSLGANIVPEPIHITESSSFPISIAPCLHFGFEF